MGRLASSSNALAYCTMVFDSGNAPGGKNMAITLRETAVVSCVSVSTALAGHFYFYSLCNRSRAQDIY